MVNFSPHLTLTRNGSLLTNMMYVDTSSSLRDSSIYLGISMYSIMTLAGLRLADLPFNEVTSGPKISLAFFMSLKVTGKLTIMFERTILPKSRSNRNPSRCINCHSSRSPSYSLRVNHLRFSNNVLVIRNLLYLFALLR